MQNCTQTGRHGHPMPVAAHRGPHPIFPAAADDGQHQILETAKCRT